MRHIPIRHKITHILVQFGLKIIKLLVQLKPHVLTFVRRIAMPFKWFGRFFIRFIALPLYYIGYLLKKRFIEIYKPARNKFMFFITNRYTVHITVGFLVVLTGFLNLQTADVRDEAFGEKSAIFKIVSAQENFLIEDSSSANNANTLATVHYRDQNALSDFYRGVDMIGGDSDANAFFGGVFSSAADSSRSASIAPREEVEVYTVQSGDTLSTIAEDFGISLDTLLWANDLTARSVLKLGQELTILPISGVSHKVASGDTVSSLANEYEAEEDEIIRFNKLADAGDLVLGEEIIIPGGEIQQTQVVYTPPTYTAPEVSIPIVEAPSTVVEEVIDYNPGTGVMIWPTDLTYITQYYGWRHTGVDIDCHQTHQNYAADAGTVQYVGWKGGYGYTVEINHGGGMVTRYGHHASMYVSVGQQVSKGQPIGVCGTSGKSTGTHLHFEVMVNGRFVNPLQYIKL